MRWLLALLRKRPAHTATPPFSMAEFLAHAQREIDEHIALEPDWYHRLPYQGPMSQTQARDFEIEKRALWRRVIHDARRGDIWGLCWSTRGDDLVCESCRQLEGRRFAKDRLDELAALPMHLGCRCELLPLRSPSQL